MNPYAQVAISSFRIWGRLTGYETKIENAAFPLQQEKVRMNKLFLEMGVPTEIFNYFEEGNGDQDNLPIDDATKITLRDMRMLRDNYLDKEDFEGLRQLGKDLKKVENIGRKIFKFQKELEFSLLKEKYDRAIEIKEEIKKEGMKRNKFDALYETSRFVKKLFF